MNIARNQLFMFGAEPEELPLWLQVKPSWAQEIDDFSKRNDIDLLMTLWSIGERMGYSLESYVDDGIFWADHETFWGNQPTAEEGNATEHQVSLTSVDR